MQLTCVINRTRTASRSILAGASSLVDSTNTMLTEVCTSEQCDENLAANSAAVRKFIEDMELSMVDQEHMRLLVFLSRLCRLHTSFDASLDIINILAIYIVI